MSRVIERYPHSATPKFNLQGADFALQAEPVGERNTLKLFDSALYAASTRVDKVTQGLSQGILDTLTQLANQKVAKAATWKDWKAKVKKNNPSLLVLLPHTLEDDQFFSPAMEIGDDDLLPFKYISKQHVSVSQKPTPPLVLLLGCETLIPKAPLESFVGEFRREGAAIVLSTLTPVLGRHAAPIAKMLAIELHHAATTSSPFGDALLTLRRHALANGLPAVLCLVAYGDADWRLVT